MMKKEIIGFIIGSIFLLPLLSGCGSTASPTIVTLPPSATPANTPTNEATPTSPAPSQTPALLLPVLPGTPVPMPNEPITPENVGRVQELAIWGKGRISQVAFSPNGEILAVGTAAGIWLYNAETSELLRFIETESWVNELTFGPNNKTIRSTLGGLIFAEWDINTGQQIERRVFQPPEKSYISGSLSTDGKRVAIPSSSEGYINLWETESGNLLTVLPTEETFGYADALILSSDGGLLIVKQKKDMVQVWDTQSSKRLFTFTARKDNYYNYHPLFLSPDEKWLFVRNELWNIPEQRLYCELEGFSFIRARATFSPDSRSIAVGSINGAIGVWDIKTCEHQYDLNKHSAQVIALAYSPDGKRLVSGSRDATVQIWNVEQDTTAIATLAGYWPHIPNLAMSPEGTIIFSPGFDDKSAGAPDKFKREIQVWDMKTGQVIKTLPGHQTDVRVHLSPDGKTMYSISYGDILQIWDMETLEVINSWDAASEHIILSSGGSKAAFLANDFKRKIARIIDTQTYKSLYTVHCDGSPIEIDFSPDGTKLVATTEKMCFWNVETGEQLFEVEDLISKLLGKPVWSPDGKKVAVGADHNTVLIWDMEARQFIHRLPVDDIDLLAFSPDGKILVTGGNASYLEYLGGVLPYLGGVSPSIQFWSVDTGMLLHTIDTYHAGITHFSFSADGRILATGALDGTVRLWGLP